MTRIQRSVNGFMRRIHMSRKAVFLVVEGRELDANFYGSLLEGMPEVGPGDYEVWVIDQISGLCHQRGKSAVLELHDRFRRRNALRQQNRAGSRSTLFCVDRDFDHVTGRLRRSSHVIYTCHYNVEAEVFIHTDDAVACAAALSLSPVEARQFAAHLGNWPRNLAANWREWLELCVLEAGLRTSTGASPARKSVINQDAYGPLVPAQCGAAIARIRRNSSSTNVLRTERRLRARFRNIEATEGPEAFLNGKLLPEYFEVLAKAFYGAQPVAANGSSKHVAHCYLACLDYSAAWAEPFRRSVRVHLPASGAGV